MNNNFLFAGLFGVMTISFVIGYALSDHAFICAIVFLFGFAVVFTNLCIALARYERNR